MGASSSGSDISGGVRIYREDDKEKKVRGKGERVKRPQSGTKTKIRGKRVRGIQSGEEEA